MLGDRELPLPLAEVVIYLLAFLELAEDDAVQPDCAVKAMENAGADLQRLTHGQREALAAHAAELACNESQPDLVRFLRSFGEVFCDLDES